MKLIVGLGNPGSKYASTRHNLGRALVEFVAARKLEKFSKKSKLKSSVLKVDWDGASVILAYPENYMNVSGDSVQKLVSFFSINPSSDLLIIVDDIALELGTMRLRRRGSDGGHNGLKSVDQHVGTTNYARLRLGISGSKDDLPHMPLEKFVLSSFGREDAKTIPCVYERGYDTCRLWLSQPIERVMSVVNAFK